LKASTRHILALLVATGAASAQDPTIEGTIAEAPSTPVLDETLRGQSIWALCKTGPWPLTTDRPDLDVDRAGAKVHLSAQQIDITHQQQVLLTGDVDAEFADIRVHSESVSWDEATQVMEASGNVSYEDATLALKTQHAVVNLAEHTAQIDAAEYQLRALRGHGKAGTVRIEGQTHVFFTEVSYSACDPGNLDWQLRAAELELDFENGVGRTRKATIRFKNVPVLYIPYGSFPIDDRRKSGFLAPTIGTSSDNGFDFALPYYWNIAPNMDATVRPRYISDRGWLFGGEFRYLTKNQRGDVWGEYIFDDEKTGTDRWLARYVHRGQITNGWTGLIQFRRVSDDDYFEDFGDSLIASATPYLQSQARVEGHGNWWYFLAQLEDFQVLDPIAPQNEPYKRLPRFLFTGNWPNASYLEFDIYSELVNFDRDFGTTGTRLDVYPSLSVPWIKPGYQVIPKLGVRYTTYDLDDIAGNATPDRTLPIFSLDSSLFFDNYSNGSRTRTLQPRLYYLYIDYENQDDLPVFDTIELDFTRSQLFLENVFSGADRINDANQVALALTSRHYDTQRGRELFNLTLGQIYYFRDGDVTLPGQAPRTSSESPFVADLNVMPGRGWYAGGTLHWDPVNKEADLAAVQVRWTPRADKLVNMAYRFRRDMLEQVDLSAVFPVGTNWSLLGRWNYSIRDDRTLEAFGGLQYDNCCWSFRIIGRHYIRDRNSETRNSIFFELNLKGLAAFGRPARPFLERGILGYRPDY